MSQSQLHKQKPSKQRQTTAGHNMTTAINAVLVVSTDQCVGREATTSSVCSRSINYQSRGRGLTVSHGVWHHFINITGYV